MSVALVGSTGLVGGHILTALSRQQSVQTIHAFARKDLSADPKIQPIISADSATWPSKYPGNAQLFISALGTTRALAGGFENQKKIDYDLNLDLAKAAKSAGTKAYVLVSSGGANSSSNFGYTKMKGELEEAVKALDFDQLVILRPGLIVGDRSDTRLAELILRKIATGVGRINTSLLKDTWAQDADVIGKAAVRAGLDCIEGKATSKVQMLTQADIIRLGRTEWKDQ